MKSVDGEQVGLELSRKPLHDETRQSRQRSFRRELKRLVRRRCVALRAARRVRGIVDDLWR